MSIVYDNLQDEFLEFQRDFEKAAEKTLAEEGVESAHGEISLTFVSPAEIQDLNRDHRATDAVTDVLSFPQYEAPDQIDDTAPYLLGDVVICGAVAKAQADEYGHSLRRETVYLFVHSLLHLLGYDHETEEERAVMREREEEIMAALEIPRI